MGSGHKVSQHYLRSFPYKIIQNVNMAIQKYLENIETSLLGKVKERERERERSALFAWSVLAREGRCGCLVSWIHSEKEQKYGYWLSFLYLEYLVIFQSNRALSFRYLCTAVSIMTLFSYERSSLPQSIVSIFKGWNCLVVLNKFILCSIKREH